MVEVDTTTGSVCSSRSARVAYAVVDQRVASSTRDTAGGHRVASSHRMLSSRRRPNGSSCAGLSDGLGCHVGQQLAPYVDFLGRQTQVPNNIDAVVSFPTRTVDDLAI